MLLQTVDESIGFLLEITMVIAMTIKNIFGCFSNIT